MHTYMEKTIYTWGKETGRELYIGRQIREKYIGRCKLFVVMGLSKRQIGHQQPQETDHTIDQRFQQKLQIKFSDVKIGPCEVRQPSFHQQLSIGGQNVTSDSALIWVSINHIFWEDSK